MKMKILFLVATVLFCVAYADQTQKADAKPNPYFSSYAFSSRFVRRGKPQATKGESKKVLISGGGEPPCKVELYQHSSYKGKKTTHTKSGNVKSTSSVSSLKVPTGCCVTIYDKKSYGGKSRKFCKNTKFVGTWWNKKISSIQVQRVSGGSTHPACSVQF